jgi:hypothetical protein
MRAGFDHRSTGIFDGCIHRDGPCRSRHLRRAAVVDDVSEGRHPDGAPIVIEHRDRRDPAAEERLEHGVSIDVRTDVEQLGAHDLPNEARHGETSFSGGACNSHAI